MALEADRAAGLAAAKLRAIVGDRRGATIPSESVSIRAGAAGLVIDDEGWFLSVEPTVRVVGPAIAWAAANDVRDLNILADDQASTIARRSGHFRDAPSVWAVDGRNIEPAQSAAPEPHPVPAPSTAEFVLLLEAAGVDVVVEHGVVAGEVDGLEIARVLVDDDGVASMEVGVGAHDREAFAMMHPDRPLAEALVDVAAVVREARRAGAEPHPLNRLAPSRRLREWLLRDPGLADAAELQSVPPATPRTDLRRDIPAAALGTTDRGDPVVIVASVGIDLDLVPEAADVRHAHAPDARLRLVLPSRDAHPRIREQAAALSEPAEIHTVADDWHRH